MQADRALGVAGRVKHLRGVALQADRLAVGEALVGRSGFRRGDADPFGLLLHHVEQRQVVFVQVDRRAGEALELERSADVVDVSVR